jgi:osmoprotectant transport system permease protein
MNDFIGAVDFLLHERQSLGGAEIGGHHNLPLLQEHLYVSGISILVAAAIAMPIGLVLAHFGRGQFLATSVANIGRAVPSLALLVFFAAYIGATRSNVVFALILLAIPPILTNTYVGVRQVERDAVDAARGMGLGHARIMGQVELPLAVPLIVGGLRTSAVNVVATATIGPLAGSVTLGDAIINGGVYGFEGQLGGAIAVALLAITTEAVFAAAQRAVTPRGTRLAMGSMARRNPFLAPPKRKALSP